MTAAVFLHRIDTNLIDTKGYALYKLDDFDWRNKRARQGCSSFLVGENSLDRILFLDVARTALAEVHPKYVDK